MASVDLQKHANFTRLSRLLVDNGTEALRDAFDTIHPPSSLPAVLAANRTSLLRLKPRVINNLQWDLLFPPSGNPPDSKTFDVTLLTVLFRNICGLPSSGWDVMPLPTDRSMQANIVRIKLLRNEVYAHVASTQVDNATFESLWKNISQALVELNIPQNDVDDLKTCPLGPDEEVYVKILKDWKLQEDDCLRMLENIGCSIDRLTRISEESREESEADILRKLAKHNFKSKIRNKLKFFMSGTREWLLKEVEEWFAKNDDESKMLLLTAGPGFGKSVFATKVCEDFKKNGKLAACHFCDFSNSNLRDPMMMLQSLASQMCENIVEFKEKLVDQLKRPHQVQSLKDAFRIYLQNPLDELELDEPRLVVIDGLDESAADDKNEIMNMIADYFPDLPEYIKVLVTSRPEISVTKLSDVQKIDIANNDDKNNVDLELYFRACLPNLADRKIDIFDLSWSSRKKYLDSFSMSRIINVLSIIVEKCEGSFLYAYHVQSELQARENLEKMTFDEIFDFLPTGLDSIYQTYFKRLEDELKALKHEDFDVLKILEMIAASKGHLPLIFLSRALGLAPDNRATKDIINKINDTVSCLLYVSDDQLTIFHKSVIDWLLARGYKDHKYAVKISDGNRSLWLLCEGILEEIVKSVCSGHDLNLTNDVKYVLDHGFQHLVECNEEEDLFWLVDVVIVHVLLTIYPEDGIYPTFRLWMKVLQSSVLISETLRARISWHVIEFHYELSHANLFMGKCYSEKRSRFYLESVLTYSPKGYFSDNEKKIAESLLSNVLRFVELNYCEVDFMPHAFWKVRGSDITDVAVSNKRTMVAAALDSGMIILMSAQSLVEIWRYSTKYERIPFCAFAPDDSFVLFGKLETALSIAERKEIPFFNGNEEKFTSCAFSPNGRRLVTCCDSSIIKLWDIPKQRLLSLLCAEAPVNQCSFSNTGLSIFGYWKPGLILQGSVNESSESRAEDSFCVWNAITRKRSDKRNSSIVNVKQPGAFQGKKCERCFRSGLNSFKISEIESCLPWKDWVKTWSAGVYNGVECIFALDTSYLGVMDCSHYTMLAAWSIYVQHSRSSAEEFRQITAIDDNLWLYKDADELFVFKTVASTQEQSFFPSRPTEVYSSSFSPNGSRVATCTSDGYINIWDVYTSQVEQRFQSNQSGSSFACWWSEKILLVFGFYGTIPSLARYPVDVNLNILFTQSQQVSLSHLVNEFVHLSAVVGFSEGFLIFKCGETDSCKVLDVSVVDRPRMFTLPGIEPMMSITVSLGGSFVFGGYKNTCYIWKRNTKGPVAYEVLYREQDMERERDFLCCFSNDSKVAVIWKQGVSLSYLRGTIIDLDTGNPRVVVLETRSRFPKLRPLCINKCRVVIVPSLHCIEFFDMDSGALIESSYQRYFTSDQLMQMKLSPKENMLAFPNVKGDMVFLRLRIPPNPLLSSIKQEAAIRWGDIPEEKKSQKKDCCVM